ncbi:MAG: T9SS type A sorting domain-containing protein [Phycisphaerae bacterium]|nr:T9SS type A sorting domain-containing protein [Saprospiraceae bacterium]
MTSLLLFTNLNLTTGQAVRCGFYEKEKTIAYRAQSEQSSCANSGCFQLSLEGPFTPQEEITLCAVFNYISTLVLAQTPNASVSIYIVKEAFIDPQTGGLDHEIAGTASPVFSTLDCGIANSAILGALHGIAQGALGEGYIRLNSNLEWHAYDPNDPSTDSVPAGTFDLYSVALHEAFHLMGFASNITTMADTSGLLIGGSNIGNIYARWDSYLYSEIQDKFLLRSISGATECCDQKEFDNEHFIMPDDIEHLCASGLFFRSAGLNIAEINSIAGQNTTNTLSHVPDACNAGLHVMNPFLLSGEKRRSPASDERAILCALGYSVANCGTAACSLQAEKEEISTVESGKVLTFNQDGLTANDLFPSNGMFSYDMSCGNVPNTAYQINGLTIAIKTLGLLPGIYHFCYIIMGCDGQCDEATVTFLVTDPSGSVCCDQLQGCDINCLGDMESFVGNADMRLLLCQCESPNEDPCMFHVNGLNQVNSPDLLINSGILGACAGGIVTIPVPSGNKMLYLGTANFPPPFNQNGEAVAFPLCERILPNDGVEVRFLASVKTCFPNNPRARIEFTSEPPVPFEIIYSNPGITGGPFFVPFLSKVTDNPPFVPHQTQPITNTSGSVWNYLLLSSDVDYFPNLNTSLSSYYDNIEVLLTRNFSSRYTITALVVPSTYYLSEAVTIDYTVCNTSSDETHEIDFEAVLPLGLTFVPSTEFPTLSITEPAAWLLPGVCKHLYLTAQIDNNVALIGQVLAVTLNATGSPIACWKKASVTSEITPIKNPSSAFTCPCTGLHELNIDAGDPSTNPNDPNVSLTPIFATQIPQHTLNSSFSPNTLFNTCLAIKGNLVIDKNYDLAIIGGEIRMQPGAKIIVTSGAQLTLGFINGGTGTAQGIHGCKNMWRSIEVQPGGRLRLDSNIIQDAEFAVDIKSKAAATSTFSCNWNEFDRNHVGVRVNNDVFAAVNQPLGFSKNKFKATSGLLSPFSHDLKNWDAQYPFAGLFVRNAPFFVGANGNANSDNLFDSLRNGIIADKAALFVYYATIQHLQGDLNIAQTPSIYNTQRVGVFARNCNQMELMHSKIIEASRGVFAIGSSVNFLNNLVDDADIGLDIHAPAHQSIVILDNDIYFRGMGVNITEAEQATKVEVGDNDPIELIPSAIVILNKTAIGIGAGANLKVKNAKIWNNKIHISSYGVGISLGLAGNWTVQENEITYHNASSPPGGMILDGVLTLLSNNNYFYRNTVLGDNPKANLQGFSLFSSKNNVFCCNKTNGTAYGFSATGVCSGTKLRHADIGSHRIGLCIPYGYIDDQILAGNQWNGSYSAYSAQHLGAQLEVENSAFKVELPVVLPLWPTAPASQAAPGQWFTSNLTGQLSGGCASDLIECPLLQAPDPEYPPQGFTKSEKLTASYGFGSRPCEAMLQFESSRSLYAKLKENRGLLGENEVIDRFYAAEAGEVIGTLYEIDQQIAEMWTTDAATQARMTVKIASADELVAEINHIESLKKGVKSAQQGKVPDILALNKNLIASGLLVANRKTVNEIYLESIALDIFVLHADQEIALLEVASQCPKVGGEAVLQARILYARLVAPSYFDDGFLCQNDGNTLSVTTAQARFEATLAPNPSYDQFTLQVSGLPMGSNMRLKITNPNGKHLKEFRVQHGETITHALSSGLYFCYVFVGEELVEVVKLVVVH